MQWSEVVFLSDGSTTIYLLVKWRNELENFPQKLADYNK